MRRLFGTKVRRVHVFETHISMAGKRWTHMISMNIELKLFGLFWIVIKKYSFFKQQ